MNKINMLIGVFFSEIGTRLVKLFSEFDRDPEVLRPLLLVKGNWNPQRYRDASRMIKEQTFSIEAARGDLAELKSFLVDKRMVLTSILANPRHPGNTTGSASWYGLCSTWWRNWSIGLVSPTCLEATSSIWQRTSSGLTRC